MVFFWVWVVCSRFFLWTYSSHKDKTQEVDLHHSIKVGHAHQAIYNNSQVTNYVVDELWLCRGTVLNSCGVTVTNTLTSNLGQGACFFILIKVHAFTVALKNSWFDA